MNVDSALSLSVSSTEYQSVRSERNSISPSDGSRQLDTELVQMEDDGFTIPLLPVASSFSELVNTIPEEPGHSNILDMDLVHMEDDFDTMGLAPVVSSSFSDLVSISSVVPHIREDGEEIDMTMDHNFSDGRDMFDEPDPTDGYTTGVTSGGQYDDSFRLL